ncbi:TetR/AcrR family transcriptional regulator [Pararhizobium mangrovi]|uniref:TetR/AcrR family transcriptional regulator n=1 Tax=Pararhizobium mangrovi TaxID=2590452 RepID=A0A506U7K7_9HYPH|nr:TetR/AcrR family transcriptional regulator [Pararhizobium mangrovi]TPW30402.1 TetR/AcrR family transcriptional regulator [Pararhizobium mangrovi]
MGRKKTIDRDQIIAAALDVIRRDGTDSMSIDAVASAAGISKASVLYEFKTKQALIHAVVENEVARHESRLGELRQRMGCAGSTEMRAMLAAADEMPSREDRAVMLGLCSAMVKDETLRGMIREHYRKRLDEVNETAHHARGARLAFLALEGLMSMERLELSVLGEDCRAEVMKDIAWLVDQEPRAEHAS